MKKIFYATDVQTRNAVRKAIGDLARIVGMTLGPGGRPILLDSDSRPPLSTKDGVTVARQFEGETDLENCVARSALEICEKTVREAGDGTTSAIVLGAALVEAGQSFLDEHPSFSPQHLTRELNRIYREQIKPEILRLSKNIRDLPLAESKAALEKVTLVSANFDQDIAQAVCKAVAVVGQDGMCIAEEGAGLECQVKVEEGFPFNSGLADLGGVAGSAFINRQDYGDCALDACYVVLYDGDINEVGTLLPLVEKVAAQSVDNRAARSPLVVVAHRFSDAVLKFMAQNFRRGRISLLPIVTPRNGQANGKSHFLHDVAAYCDAYVFDPQGRPLPEADLVDLGVIESVKIARNEGVILSQPSQALVERRIAELKTQLEKASEFDQDLLRYRIARLTAGVATIYAGGKTAFESKERHARVVDAICAARSALEQGVVPGGGATLASLGRCLAQQTGPAQIFSLAFLKPFALILENAGMNPVNIAGLGYQPAAPDRFMVVDALKREFVEWWEGGIMDPTKVTLAVVENALSVAQLLMTLGGAIVVKNSPETAQVKAMQEGMLKAIQDDALGV